MYERRLRIAGTVLHTASHRLRAVYTESRTASPHSLSGTRTARWTRTPCIANRPVRNSAPLGRVTQHTRGVFSLRFCEMRQRLATFAALHGSGDMQRKNVAAPGDNDQRLRTAKTFRARMHTVSRFTQSVAIHKGSARKAAAKWENVLAREPRLLPLIYAHTPARLAQTGICGGASRGKVSREELAAPSRPPNERERNGKKRTTFPCRVMHA